jgi:hypothetical protein
MGKKKQYTRTPSHIKRLRSEKNQAFLAINTMLQAFDNEDYESSYRLAKEAQHSLACFWSTFGTYRGWQENGIKEEVWIA